MNDNVSLKKASTFYLIGSLFNKGIGFITVPIFTRILTLSDYGIVTSHIVAITRDTYYKLPYENGKTKYNYVVTALDRLHNESKGAKKKVKL